MFPTLPPDGTNHQLQLKSKVLSVLWSAANIGLKLSMTQRLDYYLSSLYLINRNINVSNPTL